MILKKIILAVLALASHQVKADEICSSEAQDLNKYSVQLQINEWNKAYVVSVIRADEKYVAWYQFDSAETGNISKIFDLSSDSNFLPNNLHLDSLSDQSEKRYALWGEGVFKNQVIFKKSECRDPNQPHMPACPYRPHCL